MIVGYESLEFEGSFRDLGMQTREILGVRLPKNRASGMVQHPKETATCTKRQAQKKTKTPGPEPCHKYLSPKH